MSDDLVFISTDFDQLEVRLATNFSKEPVFIDSLLGEGDFFCGVASAIFKEEVSKDDNRRKTTKNFVYSYLYGGGVQKMADTAGVPYSVMKRFHTKFTRELSALPKWVKSVEEEGKKLSRQGLAPYTLTELGGRRLYTKPGEEYQLVNYKIQGTATEYMQQAILRAKRAGLKPYMRMFVHDEILSVAPRSEAREIALEFQKCMTFDTEPVPLTSDWEIIEERWGRKYAES
jgi:DNA polymerase-1